MSIEPASLPLLLRATVFRPVGVLMLFVALLVVGVLSYPRVAIQMLPSGMSMGGIGLYIPVPDGTPQENMEQVAKPCEDYLRTLPGLKDIVSNSGARQVGIRLEFDPRYDLGLMVAEVRDRMDRAMAAWPPGVERYFLWRHNESEMPVVVVSMGFRVDESRKDAIDLDHLFDAVVTKRLLAVRGVARVRVWGLLDKRIEVALDRARVMGHGIPLHRLIERLGSDNRILNAGSVYDGDRELLVRIDGQFRSFAEVEEYPVEGGLRIGDFAEVRERRSVRDRLSRINGQHARAVVIHKESGANAVDVCKRIARELDAIEEDLQRTVPGVSGIESVRWLDQGEMIERSLSSLGESGAWGGLFAMAVLFLFFRRAGLTLLVTVAIPFSLLITVIWLYFSGRSLNLLSLMGLSLGIGMLVDNSIVVVENLLRQRELGLSPVEAAVAGVREVALAVSLATLTTVMVFLPLIFLADPRFQVITSEIGLPLCVSVLASLLVALVFIPQGAIWLERAVSPGALARRRTLAHALLRRAGKRAGVEVLEAEESTRTPRFRWTALPNRGTVALVRWALRRRGLAFLACLALLATTKPAFDLVPKDVANMDGPRRLEARLDLPDNFTLAEADATFEVVENAIRRAGESFGIRAISSWFDSQGGDLQIFLEPGRRVKEKEFFDRVGPELPRLPGVKYHLGFEDFGADRGNERLRVYLEGNHYSDLEEAAAIVEAALADRQVFPYLHEVERWREDEQEEVRVRVDRRAAQHRGIDTASVSRMVSWALRGTPLPDFVVGDQEKPFWIRYRDADMENVEALRDVLVFRPDGNAVPLASVARLEMEQGSGDIHRRNGRMTVGFSARAEGIPLEEARARVHYELRRLALPEGCEISMRAPSGSFQEDMESASIALGMALALVFFVMGLLFESWLLPLSVLFSIPFSFFGSLWLLVVLGISLDAIGMIGMLMLVGIVVNNAIVLVDTINRRRKEGCDRTTAILTAIAERFRPVWMTALTTMFGLLPLLVFEQRGDGADYKSLAVVLIGGLGASTAFTLLMVPILYASLDDVRRVARGLLRGLA